MQLPQVPFEEEYAVNLPEIGLTFAQLSIEDQFVNKFNSSYQENEEFARIFVDKQKALNINHCTICKQISITSTDLVCSNCRKFTHPDVFDINDPNAKLNPYCALNNMQPGVVPEELTGLTFIEQILISRVKICLTVFRLRGGQFGYNRQVINFNQDVSELARSLPHTLDSLSNVLIIRRETENLSSFSEFRVRKMVVWNALLYLTRHHSGYRGIVNIEQCNLDQLPEDGTVIDRLTQVPLSEQHQREEAAIADENDGEITQQGELIDLIEHTAAPNVQMPNMRQNVNRLLEINEPDNGIPILQFPAMDRQPINEFTTPGYITCGFPHLFPTGEVDLNDERLKKVSANEYFKHLLLHESGRFAHDPRFRYFACNSLLRWDALKKGKIFVQKNSEIANLSPDALRQALIDSPALYRKVLCYNSNLRSTRSYWYARSKELQDMVQTIGAPTLFFTLSAADIQWPELYRLLDPNFNPAEPIVDEFRENRRRAKLLNDNPLIVAWFFQQRADSFIRDVLFKKLPVKDSWLRIEFQHRGSPHIHGFVWLENAPCVANLDSMSQEELDIVVNYFEQIVTTSNISNIMTRPPINPCKLHYTDVDNHQMYADIELDTQIRTSMAKHLTDYKNLINSVQRHTKCTQNCLRKKRGSQAFACRYKFPKELVERSKIVQMDNNKFELQLKRNDERLNSHFPFISVHWRANTDVQPIISLDAVVQYIAKYAAKCEPASDALMEIQEALNSTRAANQTTAGIIQRILVKQCAERDYSAQECIWIILGFPFYSSSRKFVIINLSPDAFVPAEIVNDENTSSMVRDVEKSYADRLNNFQIARPRGRPGPNAEQDHENRTRDERELVAQMSMVQFYSVYYKSSKNATPWSKYTKKPIVRTFPRLTLRTDVQASENERFYELQVKLHIPWHVDLRTTLNPDNAPWSEIYHQHRNQIPNYINLHQLVAEEEEEEFDEVSQEHLAELNLHEWMIYARMQPDQVLQEAELGLREMDTNINWYESYQNYPNVDQLRNFVKKKKEDLQEIGEHLAMPEVTFSPDQQKLLDLLHAQVHFCRTGIRTNQYRQSVVIQGKAGSGKTTLIQAIKFILSQAFGSDSYIVMAPTGAAAANIDAATIHATLKINIDFLLQDLRSEALTKLQDDLKNCRFVIIDEMSLIGCSLLKKIDLRLRQITGCHNEAFGGKFLFLFGDLKQLPPVKDRPLYGDGYNTIYASPGQQLFRSIHASLILPTSHRQGAGQQLFRDLLDRLAEGATTVADWELLKTRRLDRLVNASDFIQSLRLFSTVNEVNNYNYTMLESLQQPVYRIQSLNNPPEANSTSAAKAENLEPILHLAIGARVMLRRNLWTSCGLVNGAIRTVTDIVVEPGEDFPLVIMIKFDRYRGPTVNGSVPIAPTESSWVSNGHNCKRTQFPLLLAFAVTIHKAQGITLDKVVVNLGEKETSLGLAYVALSRVRTLEGLAFDKGYNYTRFSSIASSRNLSLRKIEEERLMTIAI